MKGVLSVPDEWEINRSELEISQQLGREQYDGEVYKGTYLKTGLSVTVKMFKVSKQTNPVCYILWKHLHNNN